ncbi:uncharacterized protein LOC112900127 isoform X4 [Panicum hallii]|uniref:uncharacterized protein LOC112900127 isoform X4 n=1 Tax=Panicum hallii TaxID=206008 RepID=UPI000DF4D6F7|nr:uncharacterized protein LOC112900127 isoform X4 [Panicum hallii]
MANRKAAIAATILCLCFVRAQCDAAASVGPSPSPEQEQEIQMLRSKVASLELSSLALDDEINRRTEETSQLESVVRERTAQMAALVGELELLQKVNVADDESVMKANTNVDVLEKQIERLGSDLEDQVRKGESLEARATEAEKNWHEFSHKLEHAENINVEQRKKIQDLGGRLQIAQDKLSDLEKEAKLNAEELAKVHGMWLPHWLAARVVRCQEVASAKWQAHGKPVLGPLMQKVAEKSTYAQRLMEPHLQKAQNKWVPIAKKHLTSLRNTTTVYTSAVYRVCRDAIQPCTVKAREFAGHYWQECKAFSQPYISCIVALSEPHLSRANVALEPYMEPVTSGCRSLASLACEYHHQVQNGVEGFLEDTRLLTPLPADKLAWLTASALFALPVLSIYKILSATIRPFLGVLFCSKKNQAKKRQRQQPQEQAQSRQVE